MARIIPAAVPSYPGFSTVRPTDWRGECAALLDDLLADHQYRSMGRHVAFYTQPHRSGADTQVIYVYDQNWTAHVQCVMCGGEQRDWMKDVVTLHDALVSIDVEKGPSDRFSAMSKDLRFAPLHGAARSALYPIARDMIACAPIPERRREHILWVPVNCNDGVRHAVRLIAEQTTLFVRHFLSPAVDSMVLWGRQNNVTVELLP